MSKKLLLILVAVIVSVAAAATVFAVAFTASEKPVSEIGPVPEETDENNEINEIRKSEGKKPINFTEKKTESISKTDPECGMFHKGEKEQQLAYSTQVACDENGWVTNAMVFPGNMNDNNSGTDFIEEIAKDKEVKNTVMDAGYTSPVLLNEIIEAGLTPVVPYTRPKGAKTKKDKDEEQPFYSTQYLFDKEHNCYKWNYFK